MNHGDLKLTIIIGRGYGDSFHTIKNKPVPAAIKELYVVLNEKYGLNLRSILSHSFARRASRAFMPAGPSHTRCISSPDGVSSPGIVYGPGDHIRRSKSHSEKLVAK